MAREAPLPEPPQSVEPRLADARAGSTAALGDLLELCRHYLLSVANRELESQLRPKAGASDLVQETFAEAQRIFARFEGASSADLLAWLRGILLNKLAEFTRHYRGTGKRQVGREASLAGACDSQGEVAGVPPGEDATPSEEVLRQEQAALVRQALDRLPEHYRQVIVWREWEDLSFAEIGRRLGKSEDAARMLWSRAVERLQEELGIPP